MNRKLLVTNALTALATLAVTLLTLRTCGGLASDTAQAGRPGEAGHDTIVVERLRVDTVRIEQTTERLWTVERIPDKCLDFEGYSRVRLHGTRGTFNGKASEMCDPGNAVIRATINGVES